MRATKTKRKIGGWKQYIKVGSLQTENNCQRDAKPYCFSELMDYEAELQRMETKGGSAPIWRTLQRLFTLN